MPNVIDLYAGAGGLSLGASRAGFSVVAAVEIEQHAIETHSVNFPRTTHIHGDIMKISAESILEEAHIQAADVTGIIGGPPCQGFSTIGYGKVDDDRNKLFERFFEIVEQIKPAFFLAENVPGIMNPKYDKIRANAFKHVEDYCLLPPIKVVANEYGAATTRTRFFFIGYLKNSRISSISVADIEKMKIHQSEYTTVRKALEGLPNDIIYRKDDDGLRNIAESYYIERHEQNDFFFQHVTGERPNGVGDPQYIRNYEENHIVNGFLPTLHTEKVSARYGALKYGERDKVSKSAKLNPDSFCPTLRSGTGPEKGSYQAVLPIHYNYPRVIMPREAARLQGFPDWYKLPSTIWHSFRQIGNSVSPIAAEQVLRAIFQKLT